MRKAWPKAWMTVLALVASGALGGMVGCGESDRCLAERGHLLTGRFSDPYELPLPDCVRGGLAGLPGRWFISAPDQLFEFSYPRFEGSCETGFGRSFRRADDLDASDGRTFASWSDGTVYYERAEFTPPGVVLADAYCALADGTLAGVSVRADTETTIAHLTGERFGARDNIASGLDLVGETGFDINAQRIVALDLVVEGDLVYLAGTRGLDIIDVSNPAKPVAIGHHPGSYNDVVIVHGDGRTVAYLSPYAGSHTDIVDVTNPRTLSLSAQIPDYSHTMFHTAEGGGSQIYLATYTDEVPKFDVSHPLAPARIGATHVPGPMSGVHDLFVDGNRIYVSYTGGGLVAFDVSGGLDQPIELGRLATSYSHTNLAATVGGRRVLLHGDEGMTGTADGGAFLRILDGDPASPGFLTELARYQSRRQVGIHNFQLVGDRLYIAYYQDGVRVVDLADPTHPREVAHYNTWDPGMSPGDPFEGALSLQVVGSRVYVADDVRGLVILSLPSGAGQ